MNSRTISAFLAILFFCHLAALASDPDIYIFNKPFLGKVLTRNNVLYVRVDDLSKALGIKVQNEKVNGKFFSGFITDKDGAIYVPLKAFVEASGNKFLFNQQTQMIDIVPGDSTLTNSVVKNLEESTVFPEAPPVAASSSLPSGSQQTILNQNQAPSLSSEIQALRSKYAQRLSSQADLMQYLGNLQNWADQEQNTKTQFSQELAQVQQAPNRDQQLEELASIFHSLESEIPQSQHSFEAIAPPPQFQSSHALLRELVESNSELIPIVHNFSNLMLAARMATPDQLSLLMSKAKDAMQQLHVIEAVQNQLSTNYLKALKTNLDNL